MVMSIYQNYIRKGPNKIETSIIYYICVATLIKIHDTQYCEVFWALTNKDGRHVIHFLDCKSHCQCFCRLKIVKFHIHKHHVLNKMKSPLSMVGGIKKKRSLGAFWESGKGHTYWRSANS